MSWERSKFCNLIDSDAKVLRTPAVFLKGSAIPSYVMVVIAVACRHCLKHRVCLCVCVCVCVCVEF